MKRFKQHIAETLDKPYRFKLDFKSTGYYLYVFETDDENFVDVTINNEDLENGYDEESIDNPSGWNVQFEVNGSISKTGQGEQFRIFSTVGAVVQDFMRRESPDKLSFSGSKKIGDDRTKLYTRLAKKIARKYRMKLDTEGRSRLTMFVLTKK